MNYTSVSILIITYNQENYIREAIESAADQDYPDLEVIVADDASTDNTPDIICSIVAKYPPGRIVPILNIKNLGITGNSNVGLHKCNGDLIAFMGGDDVLLPGKITRQVEWFAEDDNRVLCGHDSDWIDERGSPLGSRSSDHRRLSSGVGMGGMIRSGNLFPATSVMIQKNRVPSYGFDSSLLVVSDWKLWLDVIGIDGKYGYITGVWALYRRHSQNVSKGFSWDFVRDILMTASTILRQYGVKFLLDWLLYFLHYTSKMAFKIIGRLNERRKMTD